MSIVSLRILCLALAVAAAGDASAGAALKCRGVRAIIDKTICASPEYLAMDHEIAALVDLGDVRLQGGDRRWLGESQTRYLTRRAGCQWASHNSAHPGAAVDECLHAVMETREHALRTVIDRGGLSAASR